MRLEFRKCTPSDVSQLAEISRSTFAIAFEKGNNPEDFKSYTDEAFSEKTLLKQLQDPHSFFYFLYAARKLAGYFKLNVNEAQNELKTSETMELERIYVCEPFQGRGLGFQMLKEIARIASNQKKKHLWLGVWQENTEAIRFYLKHGFKKFGSHPYFIGKDKQTDWLMRIEIQKSPFI